MSTKYIPCPAASIPNGVRFDVPGRFQGQTIERAYGGFDRAEHDVGDLYKRVTDRTTGAVTYFRRAS